MPCPAISSENKVCLVEFTDRLRKGSGLGLFVIACLALAGPSAFKSLMHFKVGVITASGLALGASLALSCVVSGGWKKTFYQSAALFTILFAISLLAITNRITVRQFGVSTLMAYTGYWGISVHQENKKNNS